MGYTVRRLPTGVFVALAVLLLGFGAFWWTRAAPAASTTGNTAPISRQVTVRLDDGRVFTYQTGRISVSDRTNQQRRYCRRSPAQYPNMRILGPDTPPVFLTRCG